MSPQDTYISLHIFATCGTLFAANKFTIGYFVPQPGIPQATCNQDRSDTSDAFDLSMRTTDIHVKEDSNPMLFRLLSRSRGERC